MTHVIDSCNFLRFSSGGGMNKPTHRNTFRLLSLLLLLFSLPLLLPIHKVNAQTETVWFKDWVQTGGSQPTQVQNEFLERVATAKDPAFGLYVASSTYNTTTQVYDLQISLIGLIGNTVWSSQYNIPNGGDVLVGNIAADGLGNVYFTGAVENGSNSYDALTVKFNSLGAALWHQTYSGAANDYDGGVDLVLDASGNVFITGVATAGAVSRDFLTIGYSSTGIVNWTQLYDGTMGLVDVAANIGFSGGVLIVFGAEQSSLNSWNMTAVRYNPTTGVKLGNYMISPNIVLDEVNGFTTDADENIYIIGARVGTSTGMDALVIKLDSDLNILWEKTYDAAGGDDVANAVAVDANGKVTVVGHATAGNGTDYLVLHYNSFGSLQWSDLRNGTSNADDAATDVTVDANGDIYVTGYMDEIGNSDFYTVLYEEDGTEIWRERYNSVYNREDKASIIQLDDDGGFLVTGWAEATGGSGEHETTIIKYHRSCEFIIPPDPEPQSTAIAFLKNNGQLKKTGGGPAGEVAYYHDLGGHFFQSNAISFTLAEVGPPDKAHRVDMKFDSLRAVKRVIALEKRPDYYNFYLENVPNGRERVPLYKRMVYCDAFTGVDVEVSSNSGNLKYYFITKPGNRPSNIQMEFEGHTGLGTNGGDLEIGTSLGNITLPEAFAYQVDNFGNRIPLTWIPSYNVIGNIVSFTYSSYDPSMYLVFEVKSNHCDDFQNQDDNLRWNTYYGGSSTVNIPFTQDDFFHHVATDGDDILICGDTYSQDFPSDPGLNQGNFANISAFLLRFNMDGVPKWSLRLGGSGDDNGFAIAADDNGNANLVGKSLSGNFPTEQGGTGSWYDGGLSGGQDAFVAQFDPDGMRNFASFFGTNDGEQARAITKSSDGKFYIGGTGKVPAKNTDMSPFATNVGSAFIARFSSDFSTHEWTSQYDNGNTFTEIRDMVTDNAGNIYLTGFTTANGVQVVGNGALTYFGGEDAFIAKISSPPHDLLFSSHYGGSGNDKGFGITVNSDGLVYVGGSTSSSTINAFITLGSYSGNGDGFMLRFNTDMTSFIGTYYGSDGEDGFQDVVSGEVGLNYFIGFTNSASINTTAPTGYYDQSSLGGNLGNKDNWIVGTTGLFNVDWETYMGGKAGDEAQCAVVNSSNKLYVTGFTDWIFPEDVDFPLRPHLSSSYFDCTVGTDDMDPDTDGFISMFDLDYVMVATENFIDSEKFNIYPNPSYGSLFIENKTMRPYRGKVFDAVGREVKHFSSGKNKAVTNLDLSYLPKGIYFLHLYGNTLIETVKIIIN